MLNDVPMEYFSPLDNDGVRQDIASRPELNGGSVDYIAPKEYMVLTLVISITLQRISCPIASILRTCATCRLGILAYFLRRCLKQWSQREADGDEWTSTTSTSNGYFFLLKATFVDCKQEELLCSPVSNSVALRYAYTEVVLMI